jgi:hypothetical protein
MYAHEHYFAFGYREKNQILESLQLDASNSQPLQFVFQMKHPFWFIVNKLQAPIALTE